MLRSQATIEHQLAQRCCGWKEKVQDLRGVVGQVEVFAGGLAQFLAIPTTAPPLFYAGPKFLIVFSPFFRAPPYKITRQRGGFGGNARQIVRRRRKFAHL